jgi:hypothetical protein
VSEKKGPSVGHNTLFSGQFGQEPAIGQHVSTSAFAATSGISARAAKKALARALAGKPWNGHRLEVRVVRSRGGRGGAAYEVAVASLPPDLAAKLAAPEAPRAPAARPARGADWKVQLVHRVIEAGPAGSEARAVRLREVAARATYPAGKRAGQVVAERTLRKWVATHEARGIVPLLKRARADRGASRVIAWRAWDRAMDEAGVAWARQHEIAERLAAMVKGCWASGEASAANIAFILSPECRELAEAAGVGLSSHDMTKLCRMPLHFAGRRDLRRARIAHKLRNDAGGFHAVNVPRVLRHRKGMRPLDTLAADVRHSDIVYQRPDGSLATVKTVCFLDIATNRVFGRPFLLPKGEMIRREHVLTALRDLADDPAWGLWRCLYMDNGGEFRLGLAAEDLTRLAELVRRMQGDAPVEQGNIISLPYNPQSKVIEGVFSTFTRSVEPIYQGYISGNRMAKKTQNQGRAPVPMPGGEDVIRRAYAEMFAFYNGKPQQRGAIAGKSPNEAFREFQESGWRSITIDPGEFSLCFGKDEKRVVQAGGVIQIGGGVFVAQALTAMVGERVMVRTPILAPDRVVILGEKGTPAIVAKAAEVRGFHDRAGAKAAQRGRREAKEAARATAHGAVKVDLRALRRKAVAASPQPHNHPPGAKRKRPRAPPRMVR